MKLRQYFKPRKPLYFGSAPRGSQNVPRKPGVLTQSEKSIVAYVAQLPESAITGELVESTAIVLRKNPDTIARSIVNARAKLAERADQYVDLHYRAATQALLTNEVGEARKAAEWYLEHVSAKDSEGKVERVIDANTESSSAPIIKIGIALGGLPSTRDT